MLAKDLRLYFCLPTLTNRPSLQLAWVPCLEAQFSRGLEAVLTVALFNLG